MFGFKHSPDPFGSLTRRGDADAGIRAIREKLGMDVGEAEVREAIREVLEEEGVEVGDRDLHRMVGMAKAGALGRSHIRRVMEEENAHVLAHERDTLYPGLAERLAAEGFAEAGEAEPVYLRFGLPPEGGLSTIGLPGFSEAGISMFAGKPTRGGH